MNITDTLVSFLEVYKSATFICESCGEIIFPKVTANEHGICIESCKAKIRGGIGNHCIKKNICEDCYQKMSMKG